MTISAKAVIIKATIGKTGWHRFSSATLVIQIMRLEAIEILAGFIELIKFCSYFHKQPTVKIIISFYG
jgi:hypothetical protein